MKSAETTEFQHKVYEACKMIPKGMFSTYKSIAASIKSSPRAVGQALKRNPYAPTVPCHRVISSNYTLGGFYGRLNSSQKLELLNDEGLCFVNGRLITADHSKFYKFSK
jgi:methylated-DNA-[protein]-cysteine S-methyltransferase